MQRYESEWVNRVIVGLSSSADKSNILNIGSSTNDFIAEQQPYIRTNVIEPLSKLGKIINVDIKDAPGVDLVANFMEPEGREILINTKPKIILVSNLLEHVLDPFVALNYITDLLPSGGILILTGPRRYPYHPDPIDNMFRPRKSELRRLLAPKFEILRLDIVASGSVLTASGTDKRQNYNWLLGRAKQGLKNPTVFYRGLRNALTPASAFCCLLCKK